MTGGSCAPTRPQVVRTVTVEAAAGLLDFDAKGIGQGRAREQLEGAVALHNILATRDVAYLADEVGMGKTYVALGVVALFRHYDPNFRVLVIAPRENIQDKWRKEWQNFVAHHIRFSDLRMRGLDGRPARPLVKCSNLLELAHETSLDANREFFARLTSFSLPLGRDDTESLKRFRDRLRQQFPWLPAAAFDLRSKESFKDQVGRALCSVLPPFDLVIVDEGHNLKHGFSTRAAARNRVLALAFGHPGGDGERDLFPAYGPRARRVLFLSATPIDDSYVQLWNQLDVFGKGAEFEALCRDDEPEASKRQLAGAFLVRRVTVLHSGDQALTKNQYRREWRRGGLEVHDEPIKIESVRQRLTLALIQKKVADILGDARFNSQFQIGMLASFESFLETASRAAERAEDGNFDGQDQTDDAAERQGIDVLTLNCIAADHRSRFGCEMSHPKMDALVEGLATAWETGRKALVFVRRVASVREIKRRLDDCYDRWLIERLRAGVPESTLACLDAAYAQYRDEKVRRLRDGNGLSGDGSDAPSAAQEDDARENDEGGLDTFFAWFFRGRGPEGIVSGANVQRRFNQASSPYSTFFEDNHASWILGVPPGEVFEALGRALDLKDSELAGKLADVAAYYVGSAKRIARGEWFEAAQAAAVDLLAHHEGPHRERAHVVWEERYLPRRNQQPVRELPDVARFLELPTFWTQLRRNAALRDGLWPQARGRDFRESFREQELRAQLLAAAARLGHAFIDLYLLIIGRIGSLEPRALEAAEDDRAQVEAARIDAYIALLDNQRREHQPQGPWNAYAELRAIAENFDLIVDLNVPEIRKSPLVSARQKFGTLLGRQQPVGGMSGQLSPTLVKQFRMPGYPLVLISTDLLQEGEDLHPFCSEVHHYGLSWTPAAIEQRIGRIDRVNSQTDRRLAEMRTAPTGKDCLQVFFPHLEDTVEVLQVRRVLQRINTFLRLMHQDLDPGRPYDRKVDVAKELFLNLGPVEQITQRLETAFPIPAQALEGTTSRLAVGPELQASAQERLLKLTRSEPPPDLVIRWEGPPRDGRAFATVLLGQRQQPCALFVESTGSRLLLRCISPVGRVLLGNLIHAATAHRVARNARVGAIRDGLDRTYDFTIEGDVLLDPEGAFDGERAWGLLRRVAKQADELELDVLQQDKAFSEFEKELVREARHGVD